LQFLEADRLAGEDGTEVNFFAAETDAAAFGEYCVRFTSSRRRRSAIDRRPIIP
jgi:hypothetical protein